MTAIRWIVGMVLIVVASLALPADPRDELQG